MGDESRDVSGPDLAHGISLDALDGGGIVAGQADGQAVVMVRVDGEVYAVDAGCTHYGVPLGGGVVVGHTLRCPAHHSRFDMRTGEAVAAPALKPLGCWSVEVRDGRAFVTGRREPANPPPAPLPADVPNRVVIVGAGAAGSACAEMLRREGFAVPSRSSTPGRTDRWTGPTSPRTTWPATRPRSGSPSSRPSGTPRTGSTSSWAPVWWGSTRPSGGCG